MVVQSCICQVSSENNSKKFLNLSKLFANFFAIVNSPFFIKITLCMEVAINITSQSSIIITCLNHAAHTFFWVTCLSSVGPKKFTWVTSF